MFLAVTNRNQILYLVQTNRTFFPEPDRIGFAPRLPEMDFRILARTVYGGFDVYCVSALTERIYRKKRTIFQIFHGI
jgi:hypothetical protein